MSNQPLKLVIVGHVDHGKSTLIGRILHDTHTIAPDKIENVKRICDTQQKAFEYAFLLDALEEEQLQGITIDTTQIRFETEKRSFLVIDAPGHKEFLKNMISGATQADAAVLMIDAHEGVKEQSKRHGYLLSLLGIKDVVVVINKLDLVAYSESVFNTIKEEYRQFLDSIDIRPLHWVPVSARHGDNIILKSEKTPWYNNTPILSILEQLHVVEKKKQEALRLTVQDVYKWDDKRIIAGRIDRGRLSVGDEIEIYPTDNRTRIKSIETWSGTNGQTNQLFEGFSAAFTVEDAFFIDRGQVIATPQSTPKISKYITVNLFWFTTEALREGKKYKLKIGAQDVRVQLHKIISIFDSSSLSIKENASEIKKFDAAKVVLRADQAIVADEFTEFTQSARFVLSDTFDVVGGGIIETVHTNLYKQNKVLTTEDREIANGHKRAVIHVSHAEVERVGRSLEKLLFESGIRSFYVSDDKTELLSVLLESGHVVITKKQDVQTNGLAIELNEITDETVLNIKKQIEI